MRKNILITGGAGFIGSHVADEMLRQGCNVRALDFLSAQVHLDRGKRPRYLHPDVDLVQGDIRDQATVERALSDVDFVYHLAAAVGVGQSMYEISNYTSINNMGTSILLEALIKHPVERLVVASSMSIYGEGLYKKANGDRVVANERSMHQLQRREWELSDEDGSILEPVPTPETKAPAAPSVYALSKYTQERMCLIVGKAYGIPTVALRFFNVYGTRQSLLNPYTGVLAIFASRLLNNQPPMINEDGRQQRDFVNVADVARACHLAAKCPAAVGLAINIGCGHAISVSEIAQRLSEILEKEDISPTITGHYRKGDIRHCVADISLAHALSGFTPQVSFEDGLVELAVWLESQVALDRFAQAQEELLTRGLAI